ncbi:MAG: beta-glucosidase [Alphaproteobacteria bacterium]|nr:beta-glucosidase [Alphaproteobacteria bacterium]
MHQRFPRDFTWGVATSAFQIEGAADLHGRGESIWDVFCRRPGAVKDGSDGRVATDSLRRRREDLALMRELGVGAYRLSVAWPRVLPHGTGRVSEPGLDAYDRLVDELLAAGVDPWVTLYHWDLPQVLEARGGWPVRATAEAFADYAEVVARRLGDRVRHWITINEPWCAAMLGYQAGVHAPGRMSWPDALAASHHLLLAHGLGVQAVRSAAPDAQVGITLNFTPAWPASASAADAEAARWFDAWFNRWYLEPVCGRGYPADQLAAYQALGLTAPGQPAWLRPGDLATIAVPTDFLGVNFYTRAICRGDEEGNLPRVLQEPGPEARTDIGWEVHPASLGRLLRRLGRTYAGPLVVTECGAAWHDGPGADGRIHDARRTAYLAAHLDEAAAAVADGVPLRGWFTWSLIDNFEWAEGTTQRFGLAWVDPVTLRRTLKESGRWYGTRVRAGGR